MSEISYAPLIGDMTWSYSRLKAFESCRHNWFLRYIRGLKDLPCFYTSYGSFLHRILEAYYTGKLRKTELPGEFLSNFRREVKGLRPEGKIVQKYIESGVNYLSSFEPLPFKPIWIEEKRDFTLENRKFTGILDFLGESESGELVLVDNKSRDLKPRSNRKRPTAKDTELDDMLRQLYLYSIPVFESFGRYPDWLCFNCFRSGVFIKEPFHTERFEEAKQWALSLIEEIEAEEDFEPTLDFFFCKWLCGVSDKCVYRENEYGRGGR